MKPDLKALLAYWQKVLRLQDWRIDARYVKDLADPDGAAVYGLCQPLPDNKTAVILVRDPDTSSEPKEAPGGVEDTLVHELMHCPMSELGIGNHPAAVAKEEQIVWAVASALVANKGRPAEARLAKAARDVLFLDRVAPSKAGARRQSAMDPEILKKALEALMSGNADECMNILKDLIASAAGGGAPPSDAPMGAEAPPGPQGDQPMPARTAKVSVIQPAAKVMTSVDFTRMFREEKAKEKLFEAARASRVGWTPKLEELLAEKPIGEVREQIEAMAVKPPEQAAPIVRAAVATEDPGAAGGETKSEPTPEEAEQIRKMDRAFGVKASSAPLPSGSWDTSKLRAAKVKPAPVAPVK